MAERPPYDPERFPFGDQTSNALDLLRTLLSSAENGQRWNLYLTEQQARDLDTVVQTLSKYRRTRPAPKRRKQ